MSYTRLDRLGGEDWVYIETLLHLRSGGRCEVQSPDCLAGRHGDLTRLPRWRRSLHHRRPRGMGGTRRVDTHLLANLLDVCGDGTTGCHAYVESQRSWALGRGLLVPNHGTEEATDPACVVVVLPSGRRVLLDTVGPFYLPAPDGLPYAV